MPGRRFHRLARSWCFALALMAGTLAARSAVAITVVACVGDSITAGGWPADLGRRLGTNYQAINYGVGGTTLLKNGDSPYWNTPAFTQSHASGPGVVVIMLGTNRAIRRSFSTSAPPRATRTLTPSPERSSRTRSFLSFGRSLPPKELVLLMFSRLSVGTTSIRRSMVPTWYTPTEPEPSELRTLCSSRSRSPLTGEWWTGRQTQGQSMQPSRQAHRMQQAFRQALMPRWKREGRVRWRVRMPPSRAMRLFPLGRMEEDPRSKVT